jgi:hypothetical protein
LARDLPEIPERIVKPRGIVATHPANSPASTR